jgi:hypothetical protein
MEQPCGFVAVAFASITAVYSGNLSRAKMRFGTLRTSWMETVCDVFVIIGLNEVTVAAVSSRDEI